MPMNFSPATEYALSSEAYDEMRIITTAHPDMAQLVVRRRANRRIAEAMIEAEKIWDGEARRRVH